MSADPIGIDDLQYGRVSEGDPKSEMVLQLLNIMTAGMGQMREHQTAPDMEALLMTAAVTYAGTLQGEMIELCGVADLTDEALAAFLTTNFRTGQRAGQLKVQRLRGTFEREQTGQGEKPS